jgi:hypothetical protein
MASTIYKMGHDELGRIESNGYVYDQASEYLGKVEDGKVYDKANEYIGYVNDSGLVYDTGNEWIGTVRDDGVVIDDAGNELAEIESPHMQFGGAAYLLLLR